MFYGFYVFTLSLVKGFVLIQNFERLKKKEDVMIMQEKEPGTYEKTGIPDPVIPGKTDMKKGEEKGTKMKEKPKAAVKFTTVRRRR